MTDIEQSIQEWSDEQMYEAAIVMGYCFKLLKGETLETEWPPIEPANGKMIRLIDREMRERGSRFADLAMVMALKSDTVRDWTNGQLYEFASQSLGFDFDIMADGSVKTFWPSYRMDDRTTYAALNLIEAEFHRRGREFMGFVELQQLMQG